MPKEFTAIPHGGSGYMQIRSSNPDPNRRYHFAISDDLCLGPDGMRELAKFVADFADECDPADAPTLIRPEAPARKKDKVPEGKPPAPPEKAPE
jgi:hypothetical protein